MADIDVRVASANARAAVESLMQLYIHDFSELWAGTAEGELGDNGRFAEDYPLDPYWRDEGHVPLLIRRAGRLAGFALLNRVSHTGSDLDHNVAEFFVARKHRRAGVGMAAAQAIFSLYPGQWETAVARRNTAALPFWRKAITSHPLARDIEETDVTTAAWNGPVLRFRILAAIPA